MRYVHIQLNTSSLKVDWISVSAPKVYTGALSAYDRFRPKAPMPFSVNFRFRRMRSADTESRPHYQILPGYHLIVDAAAVWMCQITPPPSSLMTPEFQGGVATWQQLAGHCLHLWQWVCQTAQLLAKIGCSWQTVLCELCSSRAWQSAVRCQQL